MSDLCSCVDYIQLRALGNTTCSRCICPDDRFVGPTCITRYSEVVHRLDVVFNGIFVALALLLLIFVVHELYMILRDLKKRWDEKRGDGYYFPLFGMLLLSTAMIFQVALSSIRMYDSLTDNTRVNPTVRYAVGAVGSNMQVVMVLYLTVTWIDVMSRMRELSSISSFRNIGRFVWILIGIVSPSSIALTIAYPILIDSDDRDAAVFVRGVTSVVSGATIGLIFVSVGYHTIKSLRWFATQKNLTRPLKIARMKTKIIAATVCLFFSVLLMLPYRFLTLPYQMAYPWLPIPSEILILSVQISMHFLCYIMLVKQDRKLLRCLGARGAIFTDTASTSASGRSSSSALREITSQTTSIQHSSIPENESAAETTVYGSTNSDGIINRSEDSSEKRSCSTETASSSKGYTQYVHYSIDATTL